MNGIDLKRFIDLISECPNCGADWLKITKAEAFVGKIEVMASCQRCEGLWRYRLTISDDLDDDLY